MSVANKGLSYVCDSQPFVEAENISRCQTDECTDESTSTEHQVGLRSRKPQFSGPCSFFVSLVGYSMGTSDFWRFPYLVFRNGGGAFLLPFLFFMLICGLPLMFLEVSTSQFSGRGPMAMWNMAPFFKGIGYTLLAINIVNNVYYNVLRAWILEYFVQTFKSELPWASCGHSWNQDGCIPSNGRFNNATIQQTANGSQMTSAEQFWQYNVLQLSPGLGHIDGILWNFVLYVFIWRTLVAICMVKGIKSIEKVMYVTVFLPIILMLGIWARALMLKGSVQGMLYYITPTFDRITDIQVWIEAAMMATYTLGPGWGTIPMIASENSFHGNTIKYSILATLCDFLSAVFNGLICFSILGVMAHDSGLDLENTVTSGLSLGFTVYPTAFTYFPLPQLWSAIFFINLIFVGLDAQVLSTQTLMNCLQDLCPTWFVGKRRLILVVLINILAFLVSIPFCTRGGMYIFQLLDWYAAAWTLLFVCLVECIVFSWVYGSSRISRDLEIMLGRPMPVILRVLGSFVTPTAMLILLCISFSRYRPPTYGQYVYPAWAEALGWSLAFAIISPIVIVFFVRLAQADGSIIQKLKSFNVPSDIWGPSDKNAAEKYDNDEASPTLISTFRFNAVGKRTKTQSLENNQEMSEQKKFIRT
ncbi:creatine transporter-like [Dreissena polymorpha]|uniref:Transporter n=1 Tax=Dreissena polymorpha TaxID=45954 RepID=A0A9D4IKQ9_DREPO|nr:creatine transporter-like [Dreissena polymorpha]KAH3775173.1 hypothetical protein DPMN_176572 [Dreissena polymorpha]